MFGKLGSAIYRRRWVVLVAGIIFMAASGLLGTSVFGSLKAGGYDNPGTDSQQVADVLSTQMGHDDRTLIVLFTSKDGSAVDTPAFKSAVQSTLGKIERQAGVGKITTFYSTGASQLVSNDRTSTYAVVGIDGDDDARLATLTRLRPLLTSDSLEVRLGGYTAVSQDMTSQVQQDLSTAETLSFPILFILLLLIFGSVLAASLPLFIGGMAILGAFLILRVVASFTDISIFAINIVTMLGLGLAIDYSLFVVSRFREELVRHNGNVAAALARTMQTAGRTVVFSGLTVAISMLSLMIFPQMFLKSMAWGGAAAVLIAMLAAITVLPAVLALLGPRVNSLSVRSLFRRRGGQSMAHGAAEEGSGFWYRASTFVMKRPVVVLAVTLIPLIVVGIPFLSINLTVPDQRSLPASTPSRQVGDVLANDFPKNETTPIQIVVKSQTPATSASALASLFTYTRNVSQVPGVRGVESLVNLDPRLDTGGAAAYQAFYANSTNSQSPLAAQASAAAAQYSRGDYSLVNVLFNTEPSSKESENLVKAIRAMPPPAGLSVLVGGRTAEQVDFLGSLAANIPSAFALIVGVMFVLLFLMLGSVVVPVKAVLLNILSLSASFGALVWIFQDGNLGNVLGFTPLGSVDGTMPVIIFAIAFGLSMDYEVFLLSRIKENYDRTGDTTASVAIGVQKTGTIITSAALLLVVVIGAFAMGRVLFIKEVGIGLGLAILVDATIVRTLLVPATMRLLGRYNWWAPRPLVSLYHRLGLGETETDTATEASSPGASQADRATAPKVEKVTARS